MEFVEKSLFSDMTSDYLIPSEPEKNQEVVIKLRVGKQSIIEAFVVCNGEKIKMELDDTNEYFEFYRIKYQLQERKVSYYFKVVHEAGQTFLDRRGAVNKPDAHFDFWILPGFHTPEWAKGAVMYQIFVDRFCNGDPTNNVLNDEYTYIKEYVKHVDEWDKLPEKSDIRNFYGGDLQGVMDKLDYLKDLGIEVIYFNPIFVSPSNHKYDTQDYEHIDPHFGKIVEDEGDILLYGLMDNREASKYINRTTNPKNLEASDALFAELVKKAHEKGIKIILDGVFNHCGSFHKWIDKEGIYAQTDKEHDVQKYDGYFKFNEKGEYESWWGFDTLPKLNYDESDELKKEILQIGQKWLKEPYKIDGWRLDVAADIAHSHAVNHSFFKEFRKKVKEVNSDAIILAEHYGSASDWLQGDEWDSVMNYDAFMEPLSWFLTGMEKHSNEYRQDKINNTEAFWNEMDTAQGNMPQQAIETSMNELSNHDHSRFLTRTNHKIGRLEYLAGIKAQEDINKAVFREAVVVQMTWPGAPTVYYGDEAGLCGFTDPDNRRTYPWGKEDMELILFHKEMIKIHKENQEFRTGSLKRIATPFGIIGYGRFTMQDQSLILINNNDVDCKIDVDVWEIGMESETLLERLMLTYVDTYSVTPEIYVVEEGKMQINIPAKGSIILKNKKSPKK